jgi:hypothetical protein
MEQTMKFLCLAYGAEKDWKALTAAEQNALLAQDEAIRERGATMAALQNAVTTVRAWDGAPVTTDAAFAVSGVPLAGFSIIEAADLDEVVRLVAGTPCARAKGAIEVRPISAINDASRTSAAREIDEEQRQGTTSDWRLPWEGGCRCGQLRVRISAPPLLTMACHCAGCQRMTASAFSLSAAIPSAAFSVTQGEPVIGGLHGAQRHYFCAHCMSWMFTRLQGIDQFVNLRPTMLDDASWFTPFIETCTKERLPWATTPATHSFETFPPYEDYAGLVAEYAKQASKPLR